MEWYVWVVLILEIEELEWLVGIEDLFVSFIENGGMVLGFIFVYYYYYYY